MQLIVTKSALPGSLYADADAAIKSNVRLFVAITYSALRHAPSLSFIQSPNQFFSRAN